jgi:hypothetical protein
VGSGLSHFSTVLKLPEDITKWRLWDPIIWDSHFLDKARSFEIEGLDAWLKHMYISYTEGLWLCSQAKLGGKQFLHNVRQYLGSSQRISEYVWLKKDRGYGSLVGFNP